MKSIVRSWEGLPTIIDEEIETGYIIENTLVGIANLIIDEDFIDEMKKIAEKLKGDNSLVSLLSKIYEEVGNYYFSSEINNKNREQTYDEYYIADENGMIIGTKISSLKGKNIAKCSEKSIAAYIILKELLTKGAIKRKPSLVLSQMKTESTEAEPHAFVMLNYDKCGISTRHLLFDVANPTLVENKQGQQLWLVGLYTLSDDDYEKFINGSECTPTSTYEINANCKTISEKRTYGNIQPVISF